MSWVVKKSAEIVEDAMGDNRYFKPSSARAATGGIKSRSKRGEFGESWWAKRWIRSLERFGLGERLVRGRKYARDGQVLSINVEPGLVTAMVQGTRAKPYLVQITMTTLTAAQWDALVAVLSRQAIFAARLLAGEMPDDIEGAFSDAGIALFPDRALDLETDCTCPDWSNPCKHIAAVYYLLGEEFDRDPFLIFRLRGMTRAQLMAKLTAGGDAAKSDGVKRKKKGRSASVRRSGADVSEVEASAAEGAIAAASTARPLRAEPHAFWGTGAGTGEGSAELREPPVPAALPRQLGAFPFWRVDTPLAEALTPFYVSASAYVMHRMLAGNVHHVDVRFVAESRADGQHADQPPTDERHADE